MRTGRISLEGIKRKLGMIRLVFSLVSASIFTAFTLIMLFQHWSSSVYLYIILGFVGAYILLFTALIVIIYKRGGKIKTSLKDYKSGLKILKALLTLISFFITFSVVSVTFFSSANSFFTILVLISSLVWAVFQIIFQIYRVIKRHTKKRKPKKSAIKQISRHIARHKRQ